MRKPKLLDLYSGAGGCSRGFQMAGFHVTGVDIKRQPNYVGDDFFQDDALEFLERHGKNYDVIAASPPCQAYSVTKSMWNRNHPDLIGDTREALNKLGKPWVIENVEFSPLNGILLCGSMFNLKTYRHRIFECSHQLTAPFHPKHLDKVVKMGRPLVADHYVSVVGHFSGIEVARSAMGIEWMSSAELAQAIPPAYTKFIGLQLIDILQKG